MTWVKLDDHMAEHPKFVRLGDLAPLALALQVRAMCYSARYLTDGRIPPQAIGQLIVGFAAYGIETGGVAGMMTVGEQADAFDWPAIMVKAGLWEKSRGDYVIHDYLKYNPSREQVLADREANAKRQQKFRGRNGVTNGEVTRDSGISTGTPYPYPITTSTPPAGELPKEWTKVLGKLWREQYRGTVPYAVIGKHLKPLVAEHGLPAVRTRWIAYLKATEARFASPARFAQTFGSWGNGAKTNYLTPDQVE